MKVISISFKNFRNLEDKTFFPCEGVNVICGDNAQGKTNIIEALWFFCGGHSFRTSNDKEVIKWGSSFARIDCGFFGQEREQRAEITFTSGKRKVKINGVEKNSTSALIERYCAVVFSPEHLNLIKRGPSQRRRFIDSAICREKLQNAVALSKYNRMLVQRNALLKDIYRNPSLEETLEIWDAQLARYGAVLIRRRLDYIEMLSGSARRFHSGISHGTEELRIKYISTEEIEDNDGVDELEKKFREKLLKNRNADIASGVTLSGPHRDDVEILINSKNAKAFASQGQQRSAVLSLKLAEAEVLSKRMGENPIVLLDDVLSELDSGRQDFLLNELKDCQVFITCCERSDKEQLKNGAFISIKNGSWE